MKGLKQTAITLPRFSSDYCLCAQQPGPDGGAAYFGVADMIGHPGILRRGQYMNKSERLVRMRLLEEKPDSLAAVDQMITHELARQNPQIRAVCALSENAMGYCLCAAAFYQRTFRIHWLGDCRAYHLRREHSAGEVRYEVRILTQDQNMLHRTLAEKGELVFLRNELQDLSKKLDCFLGYEDDETVQRTLIGQQVGAELGPDDCLLLMTDGLYMPLVRALLDLTHFKISLKDYYLEDWLSRFLLQTENDRNPGAAARWPELVKALVDAVRKYTRRRPEYRDDIAVLGIYPERDGLA